MPPSLVGTGRLLVATLVVANRDPTRYGYLAGGDEVP